jgi:uncharacterized protein (TIGR00369 family)
MSNRMSEQKVEKSVQAVFDQPLYEFLGLSLVSRSEGACTCKMVTSKKNYNNWGGVHGGAINAAVEGPAFIALLPMLREGEHSVTVGINITNMRALPRDKEITIQSRVTKKGRHLAFATSEVLVDGVVYVSATITKAIINL